jgi:hypothetical protein
MPGDVLLVNYLRAGQARLPDPELITGQSPIRPLEAFNVSPDIELIRSLKVGKVGLPPLSLPLGVFSVLSHVPGRDK